MRHRSSYVKPRTRLVLTERGRVTLLVFGILILLVIASWVAGTIEHADGAAVPTRDTHSLTLNEQAFRVPAGYSALRCVIGAPAVHGCEVR